MSHKFKPGDLALVVNSGEPADLGKVVEVLEVLFDTKSLYYAYGDLHEGAADGSPSAFIELSHGDVWLFDQSDLMPLRGDFEPEQQKAREAEQCA